MNLSGTIATLLRLYGNPGNLESPREHRKLLDGSV